MNPRCEFLRDNICKINIRFHFYINVAAFLWNFKLISSQSQRIQLFLVYDNSLR